MSHIQTPTVQQKTVVEFAGVAKRYGSHLALTEFDLTLQPGELVALLGPSGSGKTTALRVLAGLESCDDGRILINGDDVSGLPTSRRDMGMVFQSYSLFPHLSAGENVEFGLRMRRVPAAERRERAAAALALVGLDAHYGRFAHELSGGQQQRVALARALVTRPRVLLLDEPLSALDAKVRVQLRDEIRRIQTELGITTLFVTHDQDEALAVADRVAVMRDGRIEQVGTPEELYTRPATPFIADFVGLSNRLPGAVRHGFAEVHGVVLPLLDPSHADGPVRVFVRPEDLTLVTAGTPGDAPAGMSLAGTVLVSSFLGSLRRTSVQLEQGGTVVVQHDVRDRHQVGESVLVRFAGAPVPVEAVQDLAAALPRRPRLVR
ncbi:spermidine/putrescine ABC transporter ATP-binding protein [Cryobacterium sp. LW097]|uniref:ABC transporter ATP-binding protein n=1 Tax=unclassified Cryobacterium TaxID=2649013 RepID=UPI000B4C2358|nr:MULTISPECIES: ABC transporter ATP-binding protein [unclassified Cryobacterium]ASD22651.1 spermidine/putrescine ABC transporter ATP-binding protein [Cryobacterium sp. LW097]TFC57599.1 ABC transporter ATP-binding protein [Cryobacterium sp. TMB1-7]TFC85846.1 ABC transporter ATP-binding protein [Cryobacterium sp. TMT4-31]